MTAKAEWGRLAGADEEAQQRRAALADPGAYHGAIAASELHWFDERCAAWLNRDPVSHDWQGLDAASGTALPGPARNSDWLPWGSAFDDSDAPFYRWFTGARTNACFNEVDRHVLAGRSPRLRSATVGCWSRRCSGPRCLPVWGWSAVTVSPSICPISRSRFSTPKRPSAWASSTRRCSAASRPRPCRTGSSMPVPRWSLPPMVATAMPR